MPFGKLEPFEVGSHNWEAYCRRVKQFISLNNISEELHVATLVTHVGVTCYELMCDLCSPDLPEDKTFDQLVQIVKDHLEPQRSEIAERHMFRLRKQLQGEVISDYLKSLKHLAKHCNFRDMLEVNLRDQFVSGLLSEDMRSRLFAERNIDYKRAIELALALEAAERHAAEAASGASAKAVPEALHRIRFSTARGERGRIERHGGGQRGIQGDAAEARAGASGEGSRRGCWRCGRVGHQPSRCKFKSYSCDSCGIRGHLKVVCANDSKCSVKCSDKCSDSLNQNHKGQFFLNDSDDSDVGFYNIICDGNDGPYYLKLKVENSVVKFEIDTGSKISVISKYFYYQYFSNICLQHKNLRLKSYTGNVIEPLGYIMVNVKYQSFSQKLPLFIIENGGPPLLGRAWIRLLQIDITNFHNLSEKYENNNNTIDLLRKEFPEVFADGLGTFKTRMQLYLADKTPVFVKSRPLPLALRAPVERELERLQRDDVIYKVDRSDYGTPIVPIIKKNGDIRICGDYKITINPLLKDFHYPLPQIEDIFATLGEGKQFSKLDLSHAYQQVLLTADSQAMTAITTHVGTFVYKRVPFGIKCVPEYFEKLIEETLCGLSSTVAFQDDICVTGKDKETHLKNLRAVLSRLKTAGLRVNWSKCEFFKDSVTYLGYKIDKNGLHTDVNKIQAIVLAPSPENVTQLKSFIGLVNFYNKFCINMSSVLKPLYDLLKKNVKWNWSPECESAFHKIKKILSSSPVLAHYDPKLPLLLSVDSSAYGLGAVLAHRYPDGSERLISCASRTLNDAERNYSQLDKEALAIIFGVSRHHRYLFGRHFTLRSDHRPLSYIFGKNKGIPQTAAGRLQRYAIRLAAYNFDIEFISSSKNCFADALSRLPLNEKCNQVIGKKDNASSYLMFIEEKLPITFYEIKKETAKDSTLNKIVSYVKFGWPEKVEMECYKQYHIRRENIFLEQGCLVWGYRVIIPAKLQTAVLDELHSGHIGVVKMKQLARNYLWWSGLDADIERVCRECAACSAQRAQPPPAPLHTWEWPREPWSRLNIDFLGPFRNQYYLVILDAHSKWLEVEPVSNISAATVIACLSRIFARFGLCKVIVSDNGPPFSSFEYLSYLNKNGIKRILIAPYHPSSNGAAENMVKTVKLVLKKAIIENENLNTALCKFLFTYRNTEHCTTQKEPSVALLGHRLRGRLDLLRPNTQDIIRDKQVDQEERRGGCMREMAAGDRVLVRNYNDNLIKWKEGVVTNRTGPVSYVVKTNDDNRTCRRHVDQIIAQNGRKSRYTLMGTDTETPRESEISNEVTSSMENSVSALTSIKDPDSHTESVNASTPIKEAENCTKKAPSPSQRMDDNDPNIRPYREKLRPRSKKVMKF